MEQQVFQLRTIRKQAGQNTVAKQIGHLVPVTDRMEALQRYV
jgi:hypothetical protein